MSGEGERGLSPAEEEMAKKIEVILLPYDAVKADEALDALAEALVEAWLSKRAAMSTLDSIRE